MTKNIIAVVLLISLITACVKNETEKKSSDEIIINDSFKMTQDYVVPVKTGLVTVVTRGADTLCITDRPNQTIQIPKTDAGIVATKSDDDDDDDDKIEVNYIPSSEINGYQKNLFKCEQDYLLFFEDTKEGDYDYNDLVLYARLYHYDDYYTGAKTYLFIKPIAYGATKKIAFGIEGDKNSAMLITDDVQKDLFLGKAPFTNTKGSFTEVIPTDYQSSFYGEATTLYNGKVKATIHKDKRYNEGGWFEILISNYGYEYCVDGYANFYILVDGNKFYVASASTAAGAYPYGIAIPNGRYWLKETVSVDKGYNKFNSWVSNGTPKSWYNKAGYLNKSNFFEPDSHADYLKWNYYHTNN
jgi:hypothetical protein